MLNWLNRQKSPAAAAAAGYPQPPLANWRNREQTFDNRSRTLEPAQTAPVKRRTRSLELFSIAIVVAMIVGVDLYIFGINKRLSALESEFVEVKAWAFPASLLEGKYTSLNARMRALTDAYSGLNEKLAMVASQQQAVSLATRTPGDETGSVTGAEPAAASGMTGDAALVMADADLPSEAPAAGITGPAAGSAPASLKTSGLVRRAEQEIPQAMAESPASDDAAWSTGTIARSDESAEPVLQPAEERPVLASSEEPAIAVNPAPAVDTQPSQAGHKAGRWVINLLSDPSQSLAARFADKARDRGVTVEQNRTEVKGRVYWRVQITGFRSASEAQARAEEIKEKLNLKDIWVFRQTG